MTKKTGRPIRINGPIDELAVKVGSVQSLANEIGVDVRTVRYWAKTGRNPSGPARKLLMLVAESHGVKLEVGNES